MYLNYYWRGKKKLVVDEAEPEQYKAELIWVGLEYKLLVLGSTTSKNLYLFSLYVEVVEDENVYEYLRIVPAEN